MITLRHPTAAERRLMPELVADAFGHEHAREPRIRDAVLADPDYEAECCLVAVDGGRLVAHCAIKSTTVQLGGRALPVGRLGTVCTRPELRRQGLGRQLVTEACRRLGHLGAIKLNPAKDQYVRTFYESLGFVVAT